MNTLLSAPAPGAALELRDVARAAGSGSQAAVTELVRRTGPMIWRVCAARVDAGAADDLTQDTFLRMVRSLSSYRGDTDPRRWLLTIARRVCAEEIARRQRHRAVVVRIGEDGRHRWRQHGVHPLAEAEFADALARLPAARREALVLTAVHGMSYAEVAQVCGCPVGTVRSRVARARSDLVDALRADDAAPDSALRRCPSDKARP